MTDLANLAASYCKAFGLPEPEREHRFHAPRRWRFDLAWPAFKVAAEIHGGTWVRGRHVTGVGFAGDREKMRTALLDGWLVLEYVAFDVTKRPRMMADEIRCALDQRRHLTATPVAHEGGS